MRIVASAWKLLVGVKDALVLLFLLLFFALLYAGLKGRPNPTLGEGALLLDLNGALVEQPAPVSFGQAAGGSATRQYRLRDILTAIDAATGDGRVKAIALNLDGFTGGGQVSLSDVGAALDRFRKSGKKVLAFATGYTDDSYQLAAHASEVWLDPMGLALFAGPGGSHLYYKGLIDKVGANVHVYRVGKFKSFVEPYTRSEASPEAKEANLALAGALWSNWQNEIAKARPKAKLAAYTADPQGAVADAPGLAEAALSNGIVDKLGSRAAFGAAVARIAGSGTRGAPFAAIELPAFISAHPYQSGDGAIAVATVAGDIVDGTADAGTAGGDTIARLIDRAVATGTVKALVLRVDSPGGSALASDRIRESLVAARAAGIPVVVSMANVAASGGYWVTTAADRVFAEPATITGSIGVFGIIPTFEGALAKIGVTSDGIKTTPLSGQPDIIGGTSPAFDSLIQRSVEGTYGRFVSLVSTARRIPLARVNEIAQGRVWDGGSARQLGLVDRFGGIDAAIAEAARLAKIDPNARHAIWLEKPKSWTQALAEGWANSGDTDDDQTPDALTTLTHIRMSEIAAALGEMRGMVGAAAIQARCLECPVPLAVRAPDASLMEIVRMWLKL
ncbi:Protease 4 [Sphingomonas antarctica]|uniref:signal peptide peptidase SppA n=1 Tax=Sphingomonas antarctica TaxID=2040274 RepID=UPI0039EBD560